MFFKTKKEIKSKQHDYTHPIGSQAFPVEPSKTKNMWIIEIKVPDVTLEGGAWYEIFELPLTDLDS